MLCALSGGVDSSVAAALVQRAVGDQLTCVFVDHGLLREGEAEQVEKDFVAATGVDLVVVDAREQFLAALAGVSDPEEKRKIIGREFIRVFEQAARDVVGSAGAEGHPVEFLVQGTLYPDVVESGGGNGAANIKSHHNVGGLPEDLQFTLVEPLRTLFKDEVRAVGLELGVPEGIVWRQPFPGPGLGIRIVGEVTAERLEVLRAADADRPRGADRGRPRPRHLAVPGGAARRRPFGRRPGRRPHLRPPHRAAPGVLRGRDDGGLDAGALRRAGQDLDPHHQRGDARSTAWCSTSPASRRAPSSGSDPPRVGRACGGSPLRPALTSHDGAMTRGDLGERAPAGHPGRGADGRPTRSGRSLLVRAAGMAATAVLAFVVVAMVALGSATGQRLDRRAMDALSSPQRTTHRLVEVLSLVSVWSVALVLAACVVLALVRRRMAAAAAAMVLVAGANVTTQVLKYDVLTRPDIGFGDVNSLPSGHTTVAVSLALAGVLVAPAAWRSLVALLGSGGATLIGAGTVVGRWHRPATSWRGSRSACCGRRSRSRSSPCCAAPARRWPPTRRCRT